MNSTQLIENFNPWPSAFGYIKQAGSSSSAPSLRAEDLHVANCAAKFINSLIQGGNQQRAEGILRKCRMFIKIKEKKLSYYFLYRAIQNVRPLLELKTQQKRKGSRRKQKNTPAPVSSKRGEKLAIQWIIQGAKKRPERSMALRLYLELLNAYNKKGYAMKKKTDLHSQCKQSFFQASRPTAGGSKTPSDKAGLSKS